jgi:hypothetical protein
MNLAGGIGQLNEQHFAEGHRPEGAEALNLNPIMREGGYRFLENNRIGANRGEISVRVYALRNPENPNAVERAASSIRVVLQNHPRAIPLFNPDNLENLIPEHPYLVSNEGVICITKERTADRNVHPEIIDHFSGTIVNEPVVCEQGHTFERSYAAIYSRRSEFCPCNERVHRIGNLILNEEIKERAAAYKRVRNENNAIAAGIREFAVRLGRAQERENQLQRQHGELQERHEGLQGQHGELQQRHEGLQGQHGELQQRHEGLQGQHGELQQRHEGLQGQHGALQERYGALQERHENLQNQRYRQNAMRAFDASKVYETSWTGIAGAVPKVATGSIGVLDIAFKTITPAYRFGYGIGMGIVRFFQGDFYRCAGEIASGGVALVPGIGGVASTAIDAAILTTDVVIQCDKKILIGYELNVENACLALSIDFPPNGVLLLTEEQIIRKYTDVYSIERRGAEMYCDDPDGERNDIVKTIILARDTLLKTYGHRDYKTIVRAHRPNGAQAAQVRENAQQQNVN